MQTDLGYTVFISFVPFICDHFYNSVFPILFETLNPDTVRWWFYLTEGGILMSLKWLFYCQEGLVTSEEETFPLGVSSSPD